MAGNLCFRRRLEIFSPQVPRITSQISRIRRTAAIPNVFAAMMNVPAKSRAVKGMCKLCQEPALNRNYGFCAKHRDISGKR